MQNSKKVIAVLAVSVVLIFAAGPVGQYLGIRAGKTGRAVSTEHDSVHYFWPIEEDTIWNRSGIDTTTVLSEFNMGGNPAYVRFYRYHGDTNYADVDTNWEESGTDYKVKDEFFDTFQVYTPYKVPFLVGASWCLGMAGTYHVDIDGDGNKDTFKIWRDTARVIGREDVTVPYGLVRNAFKLSTRFYAYVGMTTQGISIRDTLNLTMVEWYKDSLWAVKDSACQFEKIYVYFGAMWIHYADGFRWQISQLTNLWLGIEEQIAARFERPKLGPNPFRGQLAVDAPDIEGPAQVLIYDATGRLVEQRPFQKNMTWRPTKLPAGVYYLVVRTARKQTVNLGQVVYLK